MELEKSELDDPRSTARLLSFTGAHRSQRNALLWLCAFRAMALPLLAWLVGHIIKGPITAGDVVAILSGTYAGQYRTVAQVLDVTLS